LQLLAKRPVLITIVVCVAMFFLTGFTTDRPFFNVYTLVNLLQNNAMLGILAVGMTCVILTGGIDLSVGSVIGWTTLLCAFLIQPPAGQPSLFHGWNPFLAMAAVVTLATLGGLIVGMMVHYLEIPPFLITLAMLFLYRGWALVVTTDEISVTERHVNALADGIFSIPDFLTKPKPGRGFIPVPIYIRTLALMGVFAVGSWLVRYTGFGRSLYAIGGSENSANLMGLPVARSKVIVYGACSFCAALAGLALFTKTSSGAALNARGNELDAIAVTVIGGTLLSGGVGGIVNTFIGLITYAIISNAMSLHAFPTGVDRMVIGGLLLAFILIQKLLLLQKRA
ncbi:MAG TPA: sugar ABC transporter permease YjfF, partial [Phycisphaerae bacterium]|nr:sugar ABC transporter permease YjfF [Phycisphaerae bacterium]